MGFIAKIWSKTGEYFVASRRKKLLMTIQRNLNSIPKWQMFFAGMNFEVEQF
jgi:hypothetical protein